MERAPHDEIGAVERPNKSRVDFHVKDVLYRLRRSFGEILNTFCKVHRVLHYTLGIMRPSIVARQLFLEFVNFDRGKYK